MRLNPVRISLLILASLAAVASAQDRIEPARIPLPLSSPLQDKNFYLLSLLERTPEVAAALEADSTLSALAGAKREALGQGTSACKDASCLITALQFQDEDTAKVAENLRRLYRENVSLRGMVDTTLRQGGTYVRFQTDAGEELLSRAWLDAAHGINHVLDVYGSGKAPRYPEIDSVSFDAKLPGYFNLLRTVAQNLEEQKSDLRLFFQTPLRFALYLLDINKRNEAARHEPMQSHDNQAALEAIPSIRWSDYPYTVIVVPGAGGDRLNWNLSPGAKLRCEIAARRWREKKAPLILVSGGYVHPNQTPFAEAIEMKRSLMEDFGVPASAILVDPHARHTTTNMRNAARLMYRYGVPFERKALVSTDSSQSAYIESAVFTKRCDDELGYQPQKSLKRLSLFDLEFVPTLESLQIDPMDPLDP